MTPHIYLASSSPRRQALLEQIGVRYHVAEISVDETWDGREPPEEYVQRLSLLKARAARRIVADKALPVLAADTAVVLDSRILGKPKDRRDALSMLERLSGRRHHVLTAVALVNEQEAVRISISTVTFAATTPAQRAAYAASGEADDKAGAYAIQGRAAAFIERMEGSYSGVVGLPLFETAELLRDCGIEVL
ncbi:MAG: septum formation inhibitor Maf [Gammaproteobacteria bacterium]|nr:septum formation inhibitor Maf [Gammaproteobacteria bacterium]